MGWVHLPLTLTGGGLGADWDREWRGDSFQGIRAFSLEHMEPIQPPFPRPLAQDGL